MIGQPLGRAELEADVALVVTGPVHRFESAADRHERWPERKQRHAERSALWQRAGQRACRSVLRGADANQRRPELVDHPSIRERGGHRDVAGQFGVDARGPLVRQRRVRIAHAVHRCRARRVPDVEARAALDPARERQLARLRDAVVVGVDGVIGDECRLNRRRKGGLRAGKLRREQRVAAARRHAIRAAERVGDARLAA